MVLTEYDIVIGKYKKDESDSSSRTFSKYYELSIVEKIKEIISLIEEKSAKRKFLADLNKSIPLTKRSLKKLIRKYRKTIRKALKNSKDVKSEEEVFATERILGLGQIGRPWSNNTFVYEISKELPNPERVLEGIQVAADQLKGIIAFKQRTTEKAYVDFIVSTGCWSSVGMSGARQQIGLSDGCGKNEVVHEIGHALGLWHEQSRKDRNEFVKVNWCHIKEDHRHNFKQRVNRTIDLGRYDYESIMHYFPYAFSSNGKPTLKSITSNRIPNRAKPQFSSTDIKSIGCLYDADSCQLETAE